MTGFVHSIESFGTVDGPGVRMVVFMQGCPMRCLYCHNPDTWETNKGEELTSEDIIKNFIKNRSFYKKGGLTVTGGEPLLQIDFLIELFKKAKEENIHTCIDTSGITYNNENKEYIKKLDELMLFTDLIMLDIKQIDDEKHKKLTGHSNKNILEFAKYTESKNVTLWVRHVVAEGFTDEEEDLKNLGSFIGELKNLQGLDVLPYHDMGKVKYKNLGIPYILEDVKPLPKEKAVWAKSVILEEVKKAKQN